MENGDLKCFLGIFGVFVLMTVFLCFALLGLDYVSSEKICEDLEQDYNLVVKFEGGLEPSCKIKMENGWWIDHRDFDIKSVVELKPVILEASS